MKTDKFQKKHRIPSARAEWHDYNGGEYFITICTKNKKHYFGEIRNAEMKLSELGRYVEENLKQINLHYPNCEIPLYVVMPNHIHAIVIIDNNMIDCNRRDDVHIVSAGVGINETISDDVHIVSTGENTNRRLKNAIPNEKMQSISHKRGRLSTSMGGLKRAITCFANAHHIEFCWQTRFHDHIIRSHAEMNKIATYIENNVSTWEKDKFNT